MVFQHAGLLPTAARSTTSHSPSARRPQQRAGERTRLARTGPRRPPRHRPTTTLSGGEQHASRSPAPSPGNHSCCCSTNRSARSTNPPAIAALLVRDLVDTHHLTALLVTHDLDDIAHLADRVVRPLRTRFHGRADRGVDGRCAHHHQVVSGGRWESRSPDLHGVNVARGRGGPAFDAGRRSPAELCVVHGAPGRIVEDSIGLVDLGHRDVGGGRRPGRDSIGVVVPGEAAVGLSDL
jgi:hypothetical protein